MTAFLPSWRTFDADHSVRLLSGTSGSGRVVALVMAPGFAAGSEAPGLALHVTQRWAEEGEMVVVADGCLENPRLHQGLGTDGDQGLSDLLTASVRLEDVAVTGPVSNLKVVPAGGRAVIRDPEQVRERLAYICSEFKAHGVTFVVFASLGSDLGRWVVEECTDIVILGREADHPAAFLASDEDRVRAVVGPPADPAPTAIQLEAPLSAGGPDATGLDESVDASALPAAPADDGGATPAPDDEHAALSPSDTPPEVDEPEEDPPEADGSALEEKEPPDADEPWPAEPAAELAAEPMADDVLEDPLAGAGVPEPDLGPSAQRPTVRWTDDPQEEEASRRAAAGGTGTPWTPAGGKADPWALAAAQLRAQDATPEPAPAVIPRRSLEDPDPSWAEESQGITFSVGPMLKQPATLWTLGIVLVAGVVWTFWPSSGDVEDPAFGAPATTAAAEPEAAPETAIPTDTPEETDPGAPTGTEDPAGEQEEAAPPPPAVEATPPAAELSAPHPRYSAGLAALGDLDTALRWAADIRADVPGHLVYIAPVRVNGTVYYRVIAGLQEGASGVAGVIAEVAEATRRDGSVWIVRETDVAFALGDFQEEEAARAHVADVTGQGIPAYVLALDYADGSVQYRVYAGGYPNASEAAYMEELLRQAGMDAPLVERRGRLPG